MSEQDPATVTHAWFQARLAPQAFGLLGEDEESRFLAHAAECAECDALMKTFAQERRERLRDGEHIPARLLARWDRTSARLRGTARRMVRAHLESCEACRQDLVMIGHTPRLDVVPELEGEEGELAASPRMPSPARSLNVVQRPDAKPARARRWFVGGSLAGALATAAAFLVVSQFASMNATNPAAPGGRPAPTVPPVGRVPDAPPAGTTSEAVPLALQPVRLELRSPTRSAEATPPAATLAPGSGQVDLALPDLFLPDETALRVVLVDGSGAEVQSLRCSAGDLSSGRSLRAGSDAHPLTAGHYRLTVTTSERTPAPIAEFEFEVRLAGR